jgi:hypothetical protein
LDRVVVGLRHLDESPGGAVRRILPEHSFDDRSDAEVNSGCRQARRLISQTYEKPIWNRPRVSNIHQEWSSMASQGKAQRAFAGSGRFAEVTAPSRIWLSVALMWFRGILVV